MLSDIELLEKLIADSGSVKEAARRLGISAPVASLYRTGKTPIGPSLREKLLKLGYTNSDNKATELLKYHNQIRKIIDSTKEELETLRYLTDKKAAELKELELTLLVADTLTAQMNYQKVAEDEEHYSAKPHH